MAVDITQYDGSDLEHDSLADDDGKAKVVKRAPNKAVLKPQGTKDRWPWGNEWNAFGNPHIWEGEGDDDDDN